MNNPARIKRLLSTHTHLLSAKQYVSLRVPSDIPDSHVALAEVEQRLSEEALVSFMDLLAACGFRSAPEAASGETWNERPRRWVTWSELRRTVPAFIHPQYSNSRGERGRWWTGFSSRSMKLRNED